VLITSQLLGNVAVVQLAKPNVEVLDDKAKGMTLQFVLLCIEDYPKSRKLTNIQCSLRVERD
jgi:hypothetical protein